MEQAADTGWFFGLLEWIESTGLSETIRSSITWFPILETTHVLAIVFVLGSIARVDLRLLGVMSRDQPISRISGEMLPYTWAAFAVALVTGSLLFTAHAVKYVETIYFILKMLMILAAGVNMLYFEFVTQKTIANWDNNPSPPAEVRFAGGLSLVLWLGVVTTGRYIGFI
jgi:hypothetical protein